MRKLLLANVATLIPADNNLQLAFVTLTSFVFVLVQSNFGPFKEPVWRLLASCSCTYWRLILLRSEERKFAQTKLANALISKSKFRLSSNEGRVKHFMNIYPLSAAVYNFLTKRCNHEPLKKHFARPWGNDFSLLFTCHCAPRTFSIKRRFQSAATVV